jgi:hypothetical protein
MNPLLDILWNSLDELAHFSRRGEDNIKIGHQEIVCDAVD